MKRWIDEYEAWPVFGLLDKQDAYGHTLEVDIPDELLARFNKVRDEWRKVQGELADLADLAEREKKAKDNP